MPTFSDVPLSPRPGSSEKVKPRNFRKDQGGASPDIEIIATKINLIRCSKTSDLQFNCKNELLLLHTLISICNLSGLLQVKGDLAAAEPLLREALEVRRETLGSRHPHTLTSINISLGALLRAKGDLVAAEPLLREALEVRLETLGSRHPHTLASINSVRSFLEAKGKLQASAP